MKKIYKSMELLLASDKRCVLLDVPDGVDALDVQKASGADDVLAGDLGEQESVKGA